MPERTQALCRWVSQVLQIPDPELQPLAGDASLRRYFRLEDDIRRYVVMDSPPAHASVGDFIDITSRLEGAGVVVPRIIAAERHHGFLLMSDLGKVHYLDKLNERNARDLYLSALETLARIQTADTKGLPIYDEPRLSDEMQLFEDWFLGRHLAIGITSTHRKILTRTMRLLNDLALAQPRRFVHRDYHSRNLMYRDAQPPGVLDYQDATLGPVTYDLISLLRDVYIVWPHSLIDELLGHFFASNSRSGVLECSYDEFVKWVDWMGVQRHLKVAGIFCRLFYRDHKPSYLGDIPVTLAYLDDVTSRYAELAPLHRMIRELDLRERLLQKNAMTASK